MASRAREHPQRDAERTQQRLVRAALRRFARHGYAVTTVRQIAKDAGVNVALIHRYFESKEGLLRACLAQTQTLLLTSDWKLTDFGRLPELIATRASDSLDEPLANAMTLLLRPTGDERAERVRLGLLRRFTEELAALGPLAATPPDSLLRAQAVIGLGLGLAALRSSGIEPLATATPEALGALLRPLVVQLLASPAREPTGQPPP